MLNILISLGSENVKKLKDSVDDDNSYSPYLWLDSGLLLIREITY